MNVFESKSIYIVASSRMGRDIMAKPMTPLAAGVSMIAFVCASPAFAQQPAGPAPTPQPEASPQSANPTPPGQSAQGPGTPKTADTPDSGLREIVIYAQK